MRINKSRRSRNNDEAVVCVASRIDLTRVTLSFRASSLWHQKFENGFSARILSREEKRRSILFFLFLFLGVTAFTTHRERLGVVTEGAFRSVVHVSFLESCRTGLRT